MNEAFFKEVLNPVSMDEIPKEFISIFQKALLIGLKEQGVLSEHEFEQCVCMLQDRCQ